MKKVTAMIERSDDGTFGIYMDDYSLSYGILGDGTTLEEALDDYYNSYEEMRQYYKGSK
ncbi:hypothetical protein Barb6XT_02515 [Bacteroidales bacterium Barb6XT]|nr:hypothetical protein Barb6XT_02515 [Bacteroidales bacterium Barb6XT]